MSLERRTHILAALTASGQGEVTATRLCDVGRRVIEVTGAGIMLFDGEVPVGSVCTASDTSAVIEELQFTLGEGPCVDAYQLDRPILEPNLAAAAEPRWLAFVGPALEVGVRAIFGFPVGIGAVRLGALDLYVDSPGPLTDDQHADALIFADVAAEYLLAMQSGETADGLATEFEQGSNFHYVVHQAAGMVSAQLGVSLADALVRLRAHAFDPEASFGRRSRHRPTPPAFHRRGSLEPSARKVLVTRAPGAGSGCASQVVADRCHHQMRPDLSDAVGYATF